MRISPFPSLQTTRNSLRITSCRAFSATSRTNPIAVSDDLTHLKSKFRAYASRITNPKSEPKDHSSIVTTMKGDMLPQFLARIHDIEPRTRRASHAMFAWRVRSGTASDTGPSSGIVLCGSSNGGEAGAGERLERLLELGNCEDVILVVFRWYGGVKLGSDRWRCISSVAKEALDRGGFLSRSEGGGAPKDGSGPAGRTGRKRR